MTQNQTMSGGEAMIQAAQMNGIDTVFGIPGAQIYPMYDAMARLGVRTITTRHEQGAAYMALGFARASGQPGAFAVVPGPGVLNTTAALCTAMGTCTPVLCLTGQVPSQFLGQGRGHLHELADQQGMLKTIIKDAFHISNAADTSAVINQAFLSMTSGRPGPVAVEMCWDTMAAPTSPTFSEPLPRQHPELDPEALAQVKKALAEARRPLIMCGAGAQHASESVIALAEAINAPVTAFRSGRGVVPEDHPLGISSLAGRLLYDDADLIIGIGSRLEMIYMRWRDMMTYEKRASGSGLIRIDIDPEEFRRFEPDIALLGDSDDACATLVNMSANSRAHGGDWSERIEQAKLRARSLTTKIQPQMAYLDTLREVLPRDGFFVPELSQMGFTSYFGFPVYEPRTYVSEGFQGTLGYGVQTALGVKVASPDRACVCVTGDGGFMFGVQELSTAVAHDIGVVTLIFNNRAYGNVRRDQLNNFDGRLNGADLENPDFVKLAESFGARGYRVDSPAALRTVLEQALAADKPCLIDVTTETGSEVPPWEFIHMPECP